jgi:hypothetical protein
MAKRWAHQLVYLPVPSSNDFRINVDDDIKQALDEALGERVLQAKQHILTQLLEPLKNAVVRLSDEKGVFRDSLVDNIADAAHRMSTLVGLADDPQLTALVEKTRQFSEALPPAQHLRGLPGVRIEAAARTQQLIDDFNALLGG